jgi:hypothetical protein
MAGIFCATLWAEPFPYVMGYDAGGNDPRQVLVANTDAKMQIWYVKPAPNVPRYHFSLNK